jgi:hypothetical protein
VNNIEMDVRGIRCGCMDWIDLDPDGEQWRALVNMIINFRVP